MKRLLALVCAMLLVSLNMCACMSETADKMKQTASEAVSDIKNSLSTDYNNDNDGLIDDKGETVRPTDYAEDNTDGVYTEEGNFAGEWDDMVDNGEVKDGDGNVGEAENDDGDANIDENAVD